MTKIRIKDKSVVKAIEEYVKVVCKNYNVYAIILFGSYAKGTEHEDSDIDIAIITDDIKTNIFDEKVNLMCLRRGIDYRLEPHIITVDDFENVETPFVKEVIDTGIRVFKEKESLFLRFFFF